MSLAVVTSSQRSDRATQSPKEHSPVGASGSGIGAGQGTVIQALHVVHKAGLFQLLRQRDGRRRRRLGETCLKEVAAGTAKWPLSAP